MSSLADDPHYRLLFESAPDAILVVDNLGVIRMNNAQAEKLLEASAGELVGMSVDKLVPLAARKNHVHLRAGFAKTTNNRPMGAGLSLHALKLSGREFPVEISLSNTDRQGRQETIVVLRDVSDRLEARRTAIELNRSRTLTTITEGALKERDYQLFSELTISSLLEPLGADVVMLADCLNHGNVVLLRCAVGNDSNLVKEKLQGDLDLPADRSIPLLVGDDNDSRTPHFRVLTGLGFKSYVSSPMYRYGEHVGVLVLASKIQHRFNGADVTFVEAVTNVISTALERWSAEEKLMDSARLESIGQLTGGVAHDFNNLLTVISGNIQILELPGMSDKEKARAITAANRAIRSGADLTAKLLAFARRQTLRPTQVDVGVLLQSFRDMLARTLGTNIQIELVSEPDLPLVLVDAGQLESALLNLVVNARDAMPEGGTLQISAVLERNASTVLVGELKGEPTSGEYVRISVQDDGSGMSDATKDRIFEPFFTTKAAGKGSGLGLSMVYGFIKQSAGFIRVTSKLGEGTGFDLFLPTSPLIAFTALTSKDEKYARGNGELVLVIEDDEAVLELAKQFLLVLGYRSVAAASRSAALACLASNEDIVLVFSDVLLGGSETGPQICVELLARKPSLRILLTSGYTKANLQSQLEVKESVELLRKPYTIEALANAIKRALS